MKKATVNDYFRHHWVKLMLFALFTAAVSFFAPLKNFQLKWLIDSKSKQEALGYMGLVFLITFTSCFFERLSRRSFTKLACGAVEQVRGQVMERVLRRPVSQYQREGDATYLSLLTTDLRTLYDDYYMSLFNIAFWGGIMECYNKPLEIYNYETLKDDPLIDVDTIGLKGSPTNVYKSFSPPVKGAGMMMEGADKATVEKLVSILNDKHII